MSGPGALEGLAVHGEQVTLAYPDAELAGRLAELAGEVIHPLGVSPFCDSWSIRPPPARRRYVADQLAAARHGTGEGRLALPMAVLVDGTLPVGLQELTLAGEDGTVAVETRSWLVQRAQGVGLGTAMREAALHLAFVGLGAAVARSSAYAVNAASLRVSEKCGYVPDGEELLEHDGGPEAVVCLRLDREAYLARPHPPLRIEGLAALATLGVAAARPLA